MSHKKMFIIGIVLILIAVGLLIAWRMIFGRPNPPMPSQGFRVGEHVFTVEIVTSTIAQARGLSGRTSLAEGAGMLFIFPKPSVQNFWMKDMHFPIDIIWIGAGKVLGFQENAPIPPAGTQLWQLPIYSSPDGVDTVLEVVAGTVARDHIQIGDQVSENNL